MSFIHKSILNQSWLQHLFLYSYKLDWPEFVSSYAPWWTSHALSWLKFGRNLLVVHYEELQKSLVHQLRVITAFLNITMTEERLLCAQTNQHGHFKRSGAQRPSFDPFTPDMKQMIDSFIHTVDQALLDRNFSGLPQEYLPRWWAQKVTGLSSSLSARRGADTHRPTKVDHNSCFNSYVLSLMETEQRSQEKNMNIHSGHESSRDGGLAPQQVIYDKYSERRFVWLLCWDYPVKCLSAQIWAQILGGLILVKRGVFCETLQIDFTSYTVGFWQTTVLIKLN